MVKQSSIKRFLIGLLTVAMVLCGATSVFAQNGHDKDHGKNDGKGKEKQESIQKKDKDSNDRDQKGKQLFLNFNDIKGGDVEWALKNIASLASLRVFEGYEDGTFQPRKSVARIEAIVAAVRLMGLREQAESTEKMSTKLNFKDADKIASQYPWAVGYVAVALENDLFAENEGSVQPEKTADRLWATTLLVKAMKLNAEARALMNTKLTFNDAKDIPAGSVGYVALAVQLGLIEGYENNTFRPDKPVTRAELAKLLDLTGEYIPSRSNGALTGTIVAITNNNTLTVKTNSDQMVTVVLDPGVFIYKNVEKATVANLVAGDVVKIRSYNGIGIFVEVIGTSAL